jgi:hypothetical protein
MERTERIPTHPAPPMTPFSRSICIRQNVVTGWAMRTITASGNAKEGLRIIDDI